jgi:hypothetical protein
MEIPAMNGKLVPGSKQLGSHSRSLPILFQSAPEKGTAFRKNRFESRGSIDAPSWLPGLKK